MNLLALFPVFWLHFLALAQDTSLKEVKEAFVNAHIPKNTSITFDPSILLEVVFPQQNGLPKLLKAGVQLPKNATTSPPLFSIIRTFSDPRPQTPFPATTLTSQFVITTIDLDAPSPQNTSLSQVRHFLAGNFSGGVLLRNSTPAVTEFKKPSPPEGSDPHRYVFLLFAQPENFEKQDKVTPKTSRYHFNISKFADSVGLGNPLGGTFMFVGPD